MVGTRALSSWKLFGRKKNLFCLIICILSLDLPEDAQSVKNKNNRKKSQVKVDFLYQEVFYRIFLLGKIVPVTIFIIFYFYF